MKLNIYVQPGAKKTSFEGLHGDAIKIKIKAPPQDGKANEELIEFISDKLGIKKSRVKISHGEKSRNKVLSIEYDNIPVEDIIEKLKK